MRPRPGRVGGIPSCLHRALVWWDFSYGLRSVLGESVAITLSTGASMSAKGLVLNGGNANAYATLTPGLKRSAPLTVVLVARGDYYLNGNGYPAIGGIQYAGTFSYPPAQSLAVDTNAGLPRAVGCASNSSSPFATNSTPVTYDWGTNMPKLVTVFAAQKTVEGAACHVVCASTSATWHAGKTVTEIITGVVSGDIGYGADARFVFGDAGDSVRGCGGTFYGGGILRGLVTRSELDHVLRFFQGSRRVYQ